MFDFRYHVVSLAAVFLALIVGIVVGIGLSGQGVLEEGEREVLNAEIARLQSRLEAATTRLEERRAAQSFVEEAYPAILAHRLEGRQIVLLFLGADDTESLRPTITETIDRAGGDVVRFRALRLPADETALEAAVESEEVDVGDVRDLGEELGEELVAGGETPLWEHLAGALVLERTGAEDEPADGVVVVRTGDPQAGVTARFLRGLYAGVSESVPAVWVDAGSEDEPVRPSGMAALENVRSPVGRVALVLLLAGEGVDAVYGTSDDADAVVPPIEPLPDADAVDGG